MARKQTRSPERPKAETGAAATGSAPRRRAPKKSVKAAADGPALPLPKPVPKAKPKPATAKAPRPPAPASRRQVKPPPPPTAAALERELVQMAHGAAGTLRRTVVALLVLGTFVGLGTGLWSLRPSPSFSSEEIASGSPFDVTFRVANDNAWLPVAHLEISCVIDQVRAVSDQRITVAATNLRFDGPQAGPQSGTLPPGGTASFTCPLRAALPPTMRDDAGIAPRAEIYFRSRYDLPLLGGWRISDTSPLFVLNTRLLPPRWTVKPGG
ncbi:MAG: hypothetical protein U1E23_01150 [Reyranellaceae bacterium]